MLNKWFIIIWVLVVLVGSRGLCYSEPSLPEIPCSILYETNNLLASGHLLTGSPSGLQLKTYSFCKVIDADNHLRISIAFEYLASGIEQRKLKRANASIASLILDSYQDYYQDSLPIRGNFLDVPIVAEAIQKDYFASMPLPFSSADDDGLMRCHAIELSGKVIRISKNYLSYAINSSFDDDIITSRPWIYEKYLVLDLQTGNPLLLEDIIGESLNNKLASIITETYLSQDASEKIFSNPILPSSNFAFTEEGLLFSYKVGEIASNTAGVINIVLPWEKVRHLLKIQVD